MELSPAQRTILDHLLEARTGQRLNDSRLWRVASALDEIMQDHGFHDRDALFSLLVGADGDALTTQLVEAMLNNETSFYRDASTFDQMRLHLSDRMGEWPDDRKFRIWSAGCSTGQEPYSIAMMVAEMLPRDRRADVEILATDISGLAVERAQAGQYSQFEVQRGLPVRAMIRDFDQRGDQWQIAEEFRDMVRFRRHNLLETPPAGQFDLILCRNVLFYFPAATRTRALDNLCSVLAPNGVIALGAGETIIGLASPLKMLRGKCGFYSQDDIEDERPALAGR